MMDLTLAVLFMKAVFIGTIAHFLFSLPLIYQVSEYPLMVYISENILTPLWILIIFSEITAPTLEKEKNIEAFLLIPLQFIISIALIFTLIFVIALLLEGYLFMLGCIFCAYLGVKVGCSIGKTLALYLEYLYYEYSL